MTTFKPLEIIDISTITQMMQDFYAIDNYPMDVEVAKTLFQEFISNEHLGKSWLIYSEKDNIDLSNSNVFIIDTIGILTKIYSYADIAYVGGGFGNPGVHNILEPATFGVPVVIGPNYSHFAEATALVNMEGCISIQNQTQLNEAFDLLLHNEDERLEKGHVCSTFVQMNKGATQTIMNHILD